MGLSLALSNITTSKANIAEDSQKTTQIASRVMVLTAYVIIASFFCFYGTSESTHRSACRRDILMKATHRETKLERNASDVISTIHSPSLSVCVRRCVREERCRSINYKASSSAGEKNCQILAISNSTASTKISQATGWIHYEPITQVKSIIILL